jgi:carboxyl-terminal processing protease
LKINKKLFTAIILGCVLIAATIIVMAGDQKEKQEQNVYQNIETFGRVLDKVLSYYVYDLDSEKLIKAAINGMLDQLDEHSVYMDRYEYENLMIDTKGAFGGLGITLGTSEGYPTVVSTLDDTPAYRLGIQGGDKIVRIEGAPTKGWKSEEAVQRLRGPEGTQVHISVTREGVKDTLQYTITREIIKVPSVSYSADIDGIGYIKLTRFAERTSRELNDAIKELEKQRIKGLILDLRGNPGGLLDQAREVSELFLGKDTLIVYTESRIPSHNIKYSSRSTKTYDRYPVVVLVSELSASASEIVAGALQDWDKAVIAGQTTFGKGSVQTLFTIGPDALKLTTAFYYTPSGRCINKNEPGNVASDSVLTAGQIKENEEAQKKREFHTADGRIVYGGGGITPDWQLTLPEFTPFERDIETRMMPFDFAVHYMAFHKVGDNFKVTDDVMKDFKSFLAENKFTASDSSWTPENTDYVKLAIKREVFRKLLGAKGAYIATLPEDKEVTSTIEMFKKAPTLKQMFAYVAEQPKPEQASEATAKKSKK